MKGHAWARVVLPLCALCVQALVAQAPVPAQLPKPGQDTPPSSFRSRVTAVPIDVRVVDKDGKAVTDLRAEDFTLLEDGVPQAIAHFSSATLTPQKPQVGLKATPEAAPFTTTPQDYRAFLIVIGRRALGDAKLHPETLNALLDFVRNKLLPQDQVALLAGAHASDFTTDHEQVAAKIEAMGREDAPPPVFPRAAVPDSEAPVETELGFADYVRARSGEPLDELQSLFVGVSYLRYVEGEKHLIFLTERGPQPTWDEVKGLTTAANNARVALNTVQSDVRIGDAMTTHPMPLAINQSGASTDTNPLSYNHNPNAPVNQPPPKPEAYLTPGGTLPERAASPLAPGESAPKEGLPRAAAFGFGGIYDLRYVAAQTGGVSSMSTDAAPVLAQIDDGTRTHYLLAYYPSNDRWNGEFRAVSVTVNRPGVKVLFRHGYSALAEAEAFDRRRAVTEGRIGAAGSSTTDVRELDLKIAPAYTKKAQGAGGNVSVQFSVGAGRLAWVDEIGGSHTASIDVAVYCADGNQKLVGQKRLRLNLSLSDATFAQVSATGVSRSIKLEVTGTPRFVKVIVFDYAANRLGSTMVKLK
jgi:VWFA-related protein